MPFFKPTPPRQSFLHILNDKNKIRDKKLMCRHREFKRRLLVKLDWASVLFDRLTIPNIRTLFIFAHA